SCIFPSSFRQVNSGVSILSDNFQFSDQIRNGRSPCSSSGPHKRKRKEASIVARKKPNLSSRNQLHFHHLGSHGSRPHRKRKRSPPFPKDISSRKKRRSWLGSNTQFSFELALFKNPFEVSAVERKSFVGSSTHFNFSLPISDLHFPFWVLKMQRLFLQEGRINDIDCQASNEFQFEWSLTRLSAPYPFWQIHFHIPLPKLILVQLINSNLSEIWIHSSLSFPFPSFFLCSQFPPLFPITLHTNSLDWVLICKEPLSPSRLIQFIPTLGNCTTFVLKALSDEFQMCWSVIYKPLHHMDILLTITASIILFFCILSLLPQNNSRVIMDNDLSPMEVDNAIEFFDEDFDINNERYSLSLIGLFVGLIPPLPLIVSIMKRKFEMAGSVTIFPLELGLFQFLFSDARDRLKVLINNPCTTGRFVVSFQEWCSPTPDVVGRLIHVPFWIQLFELPREFCTSKMGFRLGPQVGHVMESMVCEDLITRKLFLRVRVVIDATKPLKLEFNAIYNRKVYHVDVKYENCPLVCFLCGVLGHDDLSCPRKDELSGKESKYSPLLKGTKKWIQLNERTMRAIENPQAPKRMNNPPAVLNKFVLPQASNQVPPVAPPLLDPTDPFLHHQQFTTSSPSVQMTTSEVVNLIAQQDSPPPMPTHGNHSQVTRNDGKGKKTNRTNVMMQGTRFGISEEDLWDMKREREEVIEDRPAKRSNVLINSVEEASREWPQSPQ
ncbi:hypothetical protein LINPERPRIM_LOCUS25586, partial [Linum perenne]